MPDSLHLHTTYSQFDAHFMQMALREAEQAADGDRRLTVALLAQLMPRDGNCASLIFSPW